MRCLFGRVGRQGHLFCVAIMTVKKCLKVSNLAGFVIIAAFLLVGSVSLPGYVYTLQHRPEYFDAAMHSFVSGILLFVFLLLIVQGVNWLLIRKLKD